MKYLSLTVPRIIQMAKVLIGIIVGRGHDRRSAPQTGVSVDPI
jgi:hypothetical protein